MLHEIIGTPAMLEQTAEEANELAFACLKLARMLRGENKVYNRSFEDLCDNVVEEMADVRVCINELLEQSDFLPNLPMKEKLIYFSMDDMLDIEKSKISRMRERLVQEECSKDKIL